MLSETIAKTLGEYRIGPRIRALRQKKKLGLTQLAEHTGLSPALLSKIERGHNFPTLPTLLRIAMVFGVGLDHFFTEPEKPSAAVTRSKDRLRLPDRAGNPLPVYFFESLNFPLPSRGFEAYLAYFPPRRDQTEPHSHAGTELLYILVGRIDVTIGDETHSLGKGDAITFDCAAPHSYACRGGSVAQALVVTIP